MAEVEEDHELMAANIEAPNIYRVTNKQVIALATTIITTFGAIGVAYYTNRPDTTDRFYGYQGREIQKQLTELADWKANQFEDWRDTVNLKLQFIGSTDDACQTRVSRLEGTINEHIRNHQRFKESIGEQVRDLALTDARHKVRLDECLRRVGLD